MYMAMSQRTFSVINLMKLNLKVGLKFLLENLKFEILISSVPGIPHHFKVKILKLSLKLDLESILNIKIKIILLGL
jgi:hypothetical protein